MPMGTRCNMQPNATITQRTTEGTQPYREVCKGRCARGSTTKLHTCTLKGVRNPRVPIAKDTTGGNGSSASNSDAKCSTVPSPPSVMQKSTSVGHQCVQPCIDTVHATPTLRAVKCFVLGKLNLGHWALHKHV